MEWNEMRKKQIINSTVANRDGLKNKKSENLNVQKAFAANVQKEEELLHAH